jgi:glycosyltransferase involved in cell wall biosynthesis
MTSFEELRAKNGSAFNAWYGSSNEELKRKPLVIVCIPAYNEDKAIASVIMKAQAHADLVMVGDDGSTDHTVEIARKMGADVFRNPQNMGKGATLKMLMDYAREMNPSVLVTIDGDGQHDPDEIPRLVEPVLKNEADVVVGSRYVAGAWMDAPRYRRFGLRIINALTRPDTEAGGVKDTQSGFRAYSVRALGVLQWCESTGFGIEEEQLAKAAQHKLRIVEVPISVRYNGVSNPSTKTPVRHGMELVRGALRIIVEERPLLMFGVPGAVLLVAGLIVGVELLLNFNATRYFSVPTALVAVFFVFTGMMLDVAALMLYGISRIGRKIERKGYD